MGFDVFDELAAVQHRRSIARRRRPRRSALERWRAELVELRRAGASFTDLVVWLRIRHRRVVAASTISRFLERLPELAG